MKDLLPRSHVRLLEGPLKRRQTLNGEYLLQLPADRLLHNFKVNAGIASTAKPLGGWENPACGLRGHFTGHYLSACSATYAATGDQSCKLRLDELIAGLDKCQSALGGGYLSAFPESEFDKLETTFGGVWAPYYTLHKILAGLIDTYQETGNSRALSLATKLGDWIVRRMQRLNPATIDPMLRTDQINPSNEYGGIGVSLYDLYAVTRDARYLQTARLFDRDWFLKPLAQGEDKLTGLHANTHIPQAIALARRFLLTADEQSRKAAEHFWDYTALYRSYVNGGSSGPRPDHCERSEGGEHYPEAGKLARTLTTRINESCVVHNMLRLTDTISRWSEDPRHAEFRERAALNSVIGTQHPSIAGAYIYSHPLAGGSRKIFGDADNTFWCCYGTGIEAFSQLTDGIYYISGNTIEVQQFVASEAKWEKHGVTLVQQTTFPYEPGTTLTIHTSEPVAFTLTMRIPSWTSNAVCRLNGQIIPTGPIQRKWSNGDVVHLSLPMSFSVVPLPGDPTLFAFMFGPVVLAACTPHAPELGIPCSQAVNQIRTTDLARLRFEVTLVSGAAVPLLPVSEIVDEAYGVYFKAPAEEPA